MFGFDCGRVPGKTWAVLALVAAMSPAARGEGPPEPRSKAPSLPGAVEGAPDWIGDHAPFDVARFFDAPPPGQDAAPLYLNALAEFGDEMAQCFPPGPDRDARGERVKGRNAALLLVQRAIAEAPDTVTAEKIDAAIAPYDEGFHKVAMAQARKRCVFKTGLGLSALLPHAQVARQVVRVAQLRVRRALEKGDIEGAIRDVEVVLRLARDLQPRGYMVAQLVAIAMDNVVLKELILPILAAPGLKVEHCDRLLLALADREFQGVDPYAEGLRAEYLTARVTLEDFVHHQDKLGKEMGVEPGGSILAKLESLTRITTRLAGPVGAGPAGRALVPPKSPALSNKLIEARLARTSPEELHAEVARLDAFSRTLFDLGRVPFAERLRRLPEPNSFLGESPMDKILLDISPATAAFTQAVGRQAAHLHADNCLIAVRRWQLGHDGPPADLLEAVTAAGMPAVPVDPYDGKPMRLATVEGEPVVYSVGKDGVDDGGLVDSNKDSKPGDQIYRLLPRKSR